MTLWVVDATQGGGLTLEASTFHRLVLWSLVPAFLAVPPPGRGRPRRPRGRRRQGTAAHRVPGPGAPLRCLRLGLRRLPAGELLRRLPHPAGAGAGPRRHGAPLDARGVQRGLHRRVGSRRRPGGPRAPEVGPPWQDGACTLRSIWGSPWHRPRPRWWRSSRCTACTWGMVGGAAKALVADLVAPELRATAFGTYDAVIGLLVTPRVPPGRAPLAGVRRVERVRAGRALRLRGGDGRGGGGDPADRGEGGAARPMSAAPAPIHVIAAVIRRDGRYLVGRRPDGKRHGGLWEFPGGKVDPGESRLEAAHRELGEELGMQALSARGAAPHRRGRGLALRHPLPRCGGRPGSLFPPSTRR
ncbi:MAG: NUDIX domain-containing protein [Desulfobacterales bacterium]|nr:NUDIX domain-containing protein [Desulfobacterales bacterium]